MESRQGNHREAKQNDIGPGIRPEFQRCSLCTGKCVSKGSYEVLGSHEARFFQCETCSYAFSKDPDWLGEAYSSPMTRVDVGKAFRGIKNSREAKILIDLLHGPAGPYLDFGGGYGLLVRRMRDLGYNFFRYDSYSPNLFAEGFDRDFPGAEHYKMVTAFEVLEHLVNAGPIIEQILARSDSFLFSTELIPEPMPAFRDWWYFGPEHGQHVSFYSLRSLQILAQRHGKRLVTNRRDLHLITKKRIPERLFRFVTMPFVAAVAEVFFPRRSLLPPDFEKQRRFTLTNCVLTKDDSFVNAKTRKEQSSEGGDTTK